MNSTKGSFKTELNVSILNMTWNPFKQVKSQALGL